MALAPGTLVPPLNEQPVAADGQHTPAWTDFYQRVADRLAIATSGAGVTDGSNAAAGQVGEVMTASGGSVGLSSGNVASVASLTLTAGDWSVDGNVQFTAAAATVPSEIIACVNSSNTLLNAIRTQLRATFGTGALLLIGVGGATRWNVTASTTMYLLARSAFTAGSMTASGSIVARRMR
jgi:hypothetical protein